MSDSVQRTIESNTQKNFNQQWISIAKSVYIQEVLWKIIQARSGDQLFIITISMHSNSQQYIWKKEAANLDTREHGLRGKSMSFPSYALFLTNSLFETKNGDQKENYSNS